MRARSPISLGVSYKTNTEWKFCKEEKLSFDLEHRRLTIMKLSSDICWSAITLVTTFKKKASLCCDQIYKQCDNPQHFSLETLHPTCERSSDNLSPPGFQRSTWVDDFNTRLISPRPLTGWYLSQMRRSKLMDCNYWDRRWIQIRESSYRTGFNLVSFFFWFS